MPDVGRLLVVAGLVLVALGAVVLLAGKVPWLGRLPGDIRYEGEGFAFYFPLATSLVVSAVLTLVLWLVRR